MHAETLERPRPAPNSAPPDCAVEKDAGVAFDCLGHGARFQVKRIVVDPGGRLSLRSHIHRAAHWVIVSGTAEVMLDTGSRLVSEDQTVHIPVGGLHALSNPGRIPVVLIAVETGCYLGEDDIERHRELADPA